MGTVFESRWAGWRKSPKEGGGATDKTDTTAFLGENATERLGGATAKTDTTARSAPMTPAAPCALCGGQERWNDAGTWRCIACWPTPLTRATREAERQYQRRYGHRKGA
jgi:hypothetical protein